MKITGDTTLNQLAIELGKYGVQRTQITITEQGDRQVHMLTAEGWFVDSVGPTEADAFNAAFDVIRNHMGNILAGKKPTPSGQA